MDHLTTALGKPAVTVEPAEASANFVYEGSSFGKLVHCWGCGGTHQWIKTCLTPDGFRVRLCDSCWEALGLVIVPGHEVVAARCDECWRYGNPREFTNLRRSSGHANAYGGLCPRCAGEGR